jgi:hypothetical protein
VSAPRVIAVVLNWCNEPDTAACLDSLALQDYAALDLLVVDNASPDASGARLRIRYPGVLHDRTDRNVGYSGGNNRGMERALREGADFVLVLNNDTQLEPGCVRELVHATHTQERVGAVGGKILRFDEPETLWFAGGTFDRLRAIGLHTGAGEGDAGSEMHVVREVEFLTGCCLLIPAAVLRAGGYFREDFFAYVEDVELCVRLRASGFRLLYAPAARIRHKVPPRGTPPSPLQIRLRDRNRRRLARLHYGALDRARFLAWFYSTRLAWALRYAAARDLARLRALWQGVTEW